MPKSKTSKTSPKGDPKTRTATKTADPEPVDAQGAPEATTDAPDATPAETATPSKPAKKAKAPKEDLVVFAFRLTPAERDAIHKAAGPAKASRFVRALCVHAAQGDVETVTRIAEAVRDAAE